MPRESDVHVVNLALDGRLRDWLIEWRRRTHPAVAWWEITQRVNEALQAKAERLGVTIPAGYNESTVYRWAVQEYRIESDDFEEERR